MEYTKEQIDTIVKENETLTTENKTLNGKNKTISGQNKELTKDVETKATTIEAFREEQNQVKLIELETKYGNGNAEKALALVAAGLSEEEILRTFDIKQDRPTNTKISSTVEKKDKTDDKIDDKKSTNPNVDTISTADWLKKSGLK